MTGAAALALASHWRRHPLQLFTLLAGLALATALWSAVQAVNAEARAAYARAAEQLGAAGYDRLESRSGAFMDVAAYVALRRAGWQVTPVLEGRMRLGPDRVTVVGIDPLTHPSLPALDEAAGRVQPGELLGPRGLLLADAGTAARIRARPDLPPVVEVEQIPPDTIITDIGLAERLLGLPGRVSRLLILPDQPQGIPPLTEIAPALERIDAAARSDMARLTDSFQLNLTAFGLLSFAVGLFIVHGTTGLAFEQRRPVFRTLRALGLPARRLTVLALAEMVLFATLAGGAGLVLGYLVAAALLPGVAATLGGIYGVPAPGSLTLRPEWIAGGMGMSLAGALLAGAQALWRLRRLPILAAPGQHAWGLAAARTDLALGAGGLALIAAGGLAMVLLDGLIAGFALLAGLMLGAALLLPPILGLILRLPLPRRAGAPDDPLAEWFRADMRAQLPGLSLALMALLLALAANIGVGTMVASFRLTFTSWLDQRLVSELYVTARDDAQGAQIARWLRPRVDAVLPIRAVELRAAGQPVFVHGIIDHPVYRDNWPLLDAAPGAWERLARGEGVLISEQLARRSGKWTGARLALGPGWERIVLGVYADYGNPTGQAMVSMEDLLEHARNVPNRRFGIRVAPERVPELIGALRAAFDLPAGALIDQAALKARSLEIFERTFVITGALNILTLGVAGFAILTSLLTLWSMRLPQLAPLWALGITRRRLMRLEILRSVALAGLTAMLALPLGLVLARVLLSVINVEAFGWRLPMHLFPLDWLRLLLLALAAAAVAAAIPARRLTGVPPSDLLKVFANER